MNETEDKTLSNVLRGPPPPPPCEMPSIFLQNTKPKFPNFTHLNQGEDLDKIIQRLLDAEKCLDFKPFYVINTHLQSQLQEGPKCGLVALSIATSKTDSFKSADELFSQALKLGYTTQGEMYSCQNMAHLVEHATKFNTHIINGGINCHLDCILHCLQQGGLMLVPYDADYNHSPCCRKGHSSHWAVVSGIIFFRMRNPGDEDDSSEDCALKLNPELYPSCRCIQDDGNEFFTKTADEGAAKIVRRGSGLYVVKSTSQLGNGRDGKIYLAGKQGKSRFLALWPFEKLAESNNNLLELSEAQRTKDFALPEGGVAEGLKGQAILINRI